MFLTLIPLKYVFKDIRFFKKIRCTEFAKRMFNLVQFVNIFVWSWVWGWECKITRKKKLDEGKIQVHERKVVKI